jgi:glutamate racemase
MCYTPPMIGVFDSGYGGLTVLKSLLKQLPQYDYLYLGDNARAPYGGRSSEAIIQYSREAMDFLFSRGARLILVACNTVSAVALRQLQEEYLRTPNVTDKKILGVIFPLMEKASEVSKNGRIGVVGTSATVDSEAYVHELKKLNPDLSIVQQACPLLVPFIEEGWEGKPEAKQILKKYLRSLKGKDLDTLILGCTHYPLMHADFERVMGKQVNVFDTGPTVADSLENYLQRHTEIENPLQKGTKGTRLFMTTGDPERFKTLGSRFLGQSIQAVEHIEL